MINNVFLPGFCGYGFVGNGGNKGENGNSLFYTPYEITYNDISNIDISNLELVDKIKNNYKINTFKSFDKLYDNRSYKTNDLLCDSNGSIYVLNMDGDNIINLFYNSELDKYMDMKLNIKSIFTHTNYITPNGYNRVINNVSLVNISSNDKINLSTPKDIYNCNILDFNNINLNTVSDNNTNLNKIYVNKFNYLSLYKNNDTHIFKTNGDLHIDVRNLVLNGSVLLSNDKYLGGITNELKNNFNLFLPSAINTVRILTVGSYHTLNIDPYYFFDNSDNLQTKNLMFDIILFYKPENLKDYITKNICIPNINFLDTNTSNSIKFELPQISGYKRGMYFKIYDKDTSMFTSTNIKYF